MAWYPLLERAAFRTDYARSRDKRQSLGGPLRICLALRLTHYSSDILRGPGIAIRHESLDSVEAWRRSSNVKHVETMAVRGLGSGPVPLRDSSSRPKTSRIYAHRGRF